MVKIYFMKKQIFHIASLGILLTLITACSHVHKQVAPIIVAKDLTLKEYLYMFSEIGNKYSLKSIKIPKITIKFGNIKKKDGKTIYATCGKESGNLVITVDQKQWEYLTLYRKEQLMFHEFGHCILDRHHCNRLIKGSPMSIMHEGEFIIARDYKKNRHWFFIELFREPVCTDEEKT